MPVYKCRAELHSDINEVISKCVLNNIYIYTHSIHDVEWVFETDDLELNELIEFIKDIPDTHILYQTLQLEEEYTGERDWTRV